MIPGKDDKEETLTLKIRQEERRTILARLSGTFIRPKDVVICRDPDGEPYYRLEQDWLRQTLGMTMASER